MDYDAAEKTLIYSLEKNATIADAHLLRAQIMVDRGRGTEAEKALNTGLAFNFDVRDSSLYKLVMSKVFRVRRKRRLIGLTVSEEERSGRSYQDTRIRTKGAKQKTSCC